MPRKQVGRRARGSAPDAPIEAEAILGALNRVLDIELGKVEADRLRDMARSLLATGG